MTKQPVDCLIVGAGPVGLTLACQLQQYGVRFRIIDQLDEPVIRTKAAAIWSRTTEFLDQMGLAERFLESGLQCYGASLYADGKRFAHISLDSVDSIYNYVLMLPQHVTEKILREVLEKKLNNVEYGSRLKSLKQDEDLVTVELETGESIQTAWVVGCDGAHSGVRHALDLPFDGEKLESSWAVADLHIDGLPLDDEVLVFMHNEGPVAIFPLGDKYFRLVAQTDEPMNARDEKEARGAVRQLVNDRLSESVGIREFHRAGFFSIHERQVGQYQKGRVFLAGDSAHVHSPLGGQGMNTGMHDANNLAWKIAMVAKGKMGPDLLHTYHEERHPIGKWLVEATSRGTKMITNRQPIVAALRNQAAKILTNLPIVQNKVRDTLTEVEINYRDKSLSREPARLPKGWSFKKGVRAGERALDGPLTVDGKQGRLKDSLRGCRFHLLLFGSGDDNHWDEFNLLVVMVRKRYGDVIQILWIGASEEEPHLADGEKFLFDHTHQLHNMYAATDCSAYLVRPDGYVAHRSQPVDSASLREYLETWFVEKGSAQVSYSSQLRKTF